jgi:NADH-quinone oxidoreductase subunit C
MALSTSEILNVAKAVASDVQPVEHHGDLTLVVKLSELIEVLAELKENPVTQFNWAKPGERFDVVYFLYSIPTATHVRVKAHVREDNPHVPTASEVWESANWYEREAYDMYGVIFDGHPDLRRFFMPEDFMDTDGTPLYPLRKDFPLMGIPGSLPLPAKD